MCENEILFLSKFLSGLRDEYLQDLNSLLNDSHKPVQFTMYKHNFSHELYL
jgi:hypothetical protein